MKLCDQATRQGSQCVPARLSAESTRRCSENWLPVCPTAGRLGATEETSPEQVGRSCVCRGMSLQSQAARCVPGVAPGCSWVPTCVCVSILCMCCPRSHSCSDSRKMHVRKTGRKEQREGFRRQQGCVEVVSSVCLRQEHLHRHPLLAFNGVALQRNLVLSISKLKYFLFLFWSLLCTLVSDSAPGAVTYMCYSYGYVAFVLTPLCLLATHISTPVENTVYGWECKGLPIPGAHTQGLLHSTLSGGGHGRNQG